MSISIKRLDNINSISTEKKRSDVGSVSSKEFTQYFYLRDNLYQKRGKLKTILE